VSEDKTPVEHAMELLVYAPLGFMLEGRQLLPKLVERGRQQVTMARMVGQFAVQQGQNEATKALGRAGEQASAVLADLGLVNKPSEATRPRVTPAASPSPAPATSGEPTPPAADTAAASGNGDPAPASAPRSSEDSADLAISDYDSLAASQVIPRLPGLEPAELEAVRAYESDHRGRKTVLNRVAQLQHA